MRRAIFQRTLLTLAVLLTAASSSLAQSAATYDVVPRDSIVRFTVTKFMVERVDGNFHDFRGSIRYNAEQPEESSMEMSVVVRSVTSGARGRDRTIQNEDFFHSSRYPHMTFRSTGVARRGDGSLDVTGDLTIRGVTRRITVPVRVLNGNGNRVEFETSFVVDRTSYGVLGTRWSGGRAIISHDATIYMKIAAAPAAANAAR